MASAISSWYSVDSEIGTSHNYSSYQYYVRLVFCSFPNSKLL